MSRATSAKSCRGAAAAKAALAPRTMTAARSAFFKPRAHYRRGCAPVIRRRARVAQAGGAARALAALCLGGRARFVRRGGRGDGLGRGARLGRARVPRLLPRGRTSLGASARHRLALARRQTVGAAAAAFFALAAALLYAAVRA